MITDNPPKLLTSFDMRRNGWVKIGVGTIDTVMIQCDLPQLDHDLDSLDSCMHERRVCFR